MTKNWMKGCISKSIERHLSDGSLIRLNDYQNVFVLTSAKENLRIQSKPWGNQSAKVARSAICNCGFRLESRFGGTGVGQ